MTEAHLRIVKELFGDDAWECTEGDLRLVGIPKIPLPAGCLPAEAFGVYVASPLQGYESRLYLDAPIRLASGVVPSTTVRVILGRTMYAASIQGISASLPPHQAILRHIRRYGLAA